MASTLLARLSFRRFSAGDPVRGRDRRIAEHPDFWSRLLHVARRAEVVAHTLHLYGSAGIAAFGWAICELLGWEAAVWIPLWFFAGLAVYNLDRVRRDPSDEVNTPARTSASRRLRGWSQGMACAATGMLFGIPLFSRDWITLAAVSGGIAVCFHYSVPFRGWRLKDIPLLKTFLAPGCVIAAVLGLPLLHSPTLLGAPHLVAVTAWAFAVLLCNMTLCDLRDIAGDRQAGVVSLPSYLGEQRTRSLLWMMTAGASALALFLASATRGGQRLHWLALAVFGTIALASILLRLRRPQPESFYERWVEALLYLPAVALVLVRALA